MRDTIAILSLTAALLTGGDLLFAKDKVVFNRDFSPAEGLVLPQEKPYRQEICLNGLWDFQPVAVPRDWKQGNGVAPILTEPREGQWEQVKIKIPSPWNVNDWGGGIETGEGSKESLRSEFCLLSLISILLDTRKNGVVTQGVFDTCRLEKR